MLIDTIHEYIFNLIGDNITSFAQGFREKPKEITDETLPAYAVYFRGHNNDISSSHTNKRTYEFMIDIIYDKEAVATTQTVTSDLVSEVINLLEDRDNITLGGNAHFTLPTESERVEDYELAGKHYLAYQILLPVIHNKTL